MDYYYENNANFFFCLVVFMLMCGMIACLWGAGDVSPPNKPLVIKHIILNPNSC